jgi:ribosome-associated protein
MLTADDDEAHVEQRRLTESASSPTARALVAAEAAAQKMGRDIVILDVAPIIAIIDRFVLVSASNTRQVRTIVDEVQDAMRADDGSKALGVEGLEDASWVLLDYGDVVVHVFLEETRAYYDLDRLWADATRIPFEEPRVAVGDR